MAKREKQIVAASKATSGKTTPWQSHALFLCLLAIISFGVYANSLKGEFIWDDKELIVDNAYIKNWDHLSTNLTRDFFYRSQDKGKVGYYRPVITLSYMINYAQFGLKPLGYHLTNVFFHTLTALVIYSLTFSLSGSLICSLLASLLFAVHPIHTESVSWISGRTDVIAGFFFFLAFLLYVSWDKRGKIFFYAGSLIAFSLALLSKEMAVTLPMVLILYDRLWHPQDLAKGKFRWYLPYGAVVLLYLVVRFLILKVGTGNEHIESIGRFAVWLSSGKAFLYYLGKLILPVNLNAYIMMDLSSFPHVAALTGLLLLAALTFWAGKQRAEQPLLSFAFLSYILTFVPLFNIIPLNAPREVDLPMAERFLYIPSFSICLFFGLILERNIRDRRFMAPGKWILPVLSVLLVSFFLLQTCDRNRDWQSELRFYRETVRTSPRSAIFRNNLGVIYKRHGDLSHALSEFREAIRLMPDLAQAYDNLGNFYFGTGEYQEAIHEFRNALSLDDNAAETHSNLGALYFKMGDYGKSEKEFREAVRLKPQFAEAHFNLGAIAEKTGRYEEAVQEYNLALRYKPELVPAHLNLAVIYLGKRYDRTMAIYHLMKCLEIDPNQPQAGTIRKKLQELQG
ncbi:MAG: tetratricopeptide repeat protein [Proteobacteria bacterium]|nr:tetratricopeptide repeat protein [Pseudomonadota bacterium]